MLIAEIIVYTAMAYAVLGLVFALWFVTFAIGRFDPAARGTGYFFRFLILFGTIVFWPMLAVRIIKGKKENNE